jgi:hypothetical protein
MSFNPAFTKTDIADLNARFTVGATQRIQHAQQLAFEEGAFLALDAIERVAQRRSVATLADYARLEELVGAARI